MKMKPGRKRKKERKKREGRPFFLRPSVLLVKQLRLAASRVVVYVVAARYPLEGVSLARFGRGILKKKSTEIRV